MRVTPGSGPNGARAGYRLRRVARAAAFVAIVAALAGLALRFVHVVLNTSTSMPVGFYRTWAPDRAPRRGDIVTVCAPAAAAGIGKSRGYLPRGTCDAATAPLIKYVAAAGGDTIAFTKRGITVDGTPLYDSGTLARDGSGRPMRAYGVPPMRLRLARDQIWLYAPRPRSFDSRYFGPVPVTRVRAFAAPLAAF